MTRVITPNLTNVATAQAAETTGWAGFRHSGGGSPAVQDETDNWIQGGGAKSVKITSTGTRDEGLWYDNTTGIDMTVSGRHFYIWAALTTVKATNTRNLGGIYLIVASDASGNNWNKYYVGGSDVTNSGFVRYVLDLNKTPSATAATAATLSSIRWFGVGVTSTAMTAKSENLICDRIDYGTGEIQVYSTGTAETATWADVFDDDDLNANKYGVIAKEENGTYVLRSGVTFGNTAQTSAFTFEDTTGVAVRFANPEYYNGDTVVSAVDAPNLFKISAEGAAANNTTVTLGSVVGTGDDRQGINGGFISTDGPKFAIDFETGIANLAAVNLYGVTVQGAGVSQFSGSTKTDVIGCTFTNCGEIQPNDSEFFNNTVVAPEPDRGVELLSTHNTKQVSFVLGESASPDYDRVWQVDASPLTFTDYTTEARSAGANDVVFFPASEAVGDYCAMGYRRKYTRCRVDVGTARSGGSLIWEYYNGATWSALDVIIDATNTLSTTGINTVEWYTAPSDWTALSLNGEDPLYYIRIRVTSIMTTNPLGDDCFCTRLVEHLTHVPVAGTFSYDELNFFGTGPRSYHVENSDDALLYALYAESNQDSTQALGNGTIIGVAQEFSGSGGTLSHGCFMLGEFGTPPTGNVVAKVFASDNGSPAVPTGSALATSNVYDVVNLDLETTLHLIQFEFEDKFALVSLTDYFLTLEYSSGDASNYITVGTDTSSPPAGKDWATLTGSTWTGSTTTEGIFQVHTGAILTVNAVSSNVTIDQNTGDPAGATIINNPKQYILDSLVAGSEVRIFRTSDGVELDGIESSGTSFTYNHDGSVVGIYTIIQKLTHEWLRIDDTLGSTDKTVTVSQQPDINYENA